MSAKTSALIKELAALFVKYGVADWAPLVEELERGQRDRLAEAIRELTAKPRSPTRRKPKAKQGTPAKDGREAPPLSIAPERRTLLEPLLDALGKRGLAPSAHDIRELSLLIGIKDALPKRREDVAETIVRRLAELPDAKFRKVLGDIAVRYGGGHPATDDYARWFTLILDPKAPS